MAPRWLRFRSATLMVLIALVGLGLGGYRWYQGTYVLPLLDRAGKVLRGVQPQTDLSKFEARLDAPIVGALGAGSYQQVAFRDKQTGKTTTVIIPAVDSGSGGDGGLIFSPPSPTSPSPVGHFQLRSRKP